MEAKKALWIFARNNEHVFLAGCNEPTSKSLEENEIGDEFNETVISVEISKAESASSSLCKSLFWLLGPEQTRRSVGIDGTNLELTTRGVRFAKK